ncbi:hypothetical protein Lser_V15G27191 [Lactuca serriola]
MPTIRRSYQDRSTPPFPPFLLSLIHSPTFKNPLRFTLRLLGKLYDVWLRCQFDSPSSSIKKKSTNLFPLISSMRHHCLKDQPLYPRIYKRYTKGNLIQNIHQTNMISQQVVVSVKFK